MAAAQRLQVVPRSVRLRAAHAAGIYDAHTRARHAPRVARTRRRFCRPPGSAPATAGRARPCSRWSGRVLIRAASRAAERRRSVWGSLRGGTRACTRHNLPAACASLMLCQTLCAEYVSPRWTPAACRARAAKAGHQLQRAALRQAARRCIRCHRCHPPHARRACPLKMPQTTIPRTTWPLRPPYPRELSPPRRLQYQPRKWREALPVSRLLFAMRFISYDQRARWVASVR